MLLFGKLLFDPKDSSVEMKAMGVTGVRMRREGRGLRVYWGSAVGFLTMASLSFQQLFCLQNLRRELDDLLQEKIENPHPVDWNDTKCRDTAVLTAIIDLITTQENESARNYAPRFQGERCS